MKKKFGMRLMGSNNDPRKIVSGNELENTETRLVGKIISLVFVNFHRKEGSIVHFDSLPRFLYKNMQLR